MLRIKVLRMSAALSQWHLAQAAKMSQGRFSMIERGLIEPTPEERERLAQALSAPSSTLLRPAMRQKKKADCASTAQVMG